MDNTAQEDPEPAKGRKPSGSGTVRVLVVDDSALMRRLLCDLLKSAPDIDVVGTARDGRDAVVQASRLKPDVITLDVEMPEVSGLEALPLLLAVHEAPVVMVSALTQEGADVTLQALELGAVDFMPKPERNQLAEMRASTDQLVSKVRTAAQSRVRRGRQVRAAASASPHASSAASSGAGPPLSAPRAAPAAPAGTGCIVIGISTGGPQALSLVLPHVTAPVPPILIVQHMPAQFTGVFAQRLDRACGLKVKEAVEGDPVSPNQILIAPGGRHMAISGTTSRPRVTLSDDEAVSGHKPSVDVLFKSAARIFQSSAVGIMMTGMGRDGVDGSLAILAAGGFTIGQDEASSVVYGMNKAAFLEKAIKVQFALDELAGIINRIANYRDENT